MAAVHPHLSAGGDFAKTGRMATIALAVAAILVGIVLVVAVGYLSYRGPLQTGQHPGPSDQPPVTR
jgi:hypothetical protein